MFKIKKLSSNSNAVVEGVFSPVEALLEDVKAGRPVILVDDEARENEGDLIVAAEAITPALINFMITHGRGLVCMPIAKEIADRLDLQPMTARNTSKFGTAFTVSIGAKEGVTTGISAADRAQTVKTAINPESGPDEISVPGHIFPLIAAEGGVLVREGHTEAAVDLARLAGFAPAGVICEILNKDGTMARVPDLIGFCEEHDLKMGTIAALKRYRQEKESKA